MRRTAWTILLLAAATAAAIAASPPELLNYQGVLRNASDLPREGDHDMVFVFYSAQVGGDEILVDRHTVAHSTPVTVSGGLFNVALGGGSVMDGVGPGIYNTLSEMFRDYGNVWMAIQVNGETLSPRVQVVSSAYAFNAAHLGGKKAGEYIDTSGLSQIKNGDLAVSNLTANGPYVYFGNGGQIRSEPGYMELKNDADTDSLYLKGGNSAADGQVVIFGQSYMELKAGTGEFRFYRGNSGVEVANLSGTGNLQIDGGLTTQGNYSYLGDNTTIYSGGSLTSISNNEDTDVVRLTAGDTTDDGMIEIAGGSDIVLQSGNGNVQFRYGPTFTEKALLNGDGDLQIDGELDADGLYHHFGTNATLYSGSTITSLYNNNNSDWLRLVGGYNLLDSSYIELKGAAGIEFRAADGNFVFWNVDTGQQKAGINQYGDLQLDGYLDDDGSMNVVANSFLSVAGSPAMMTIGGANMELGLGDSSLDNVNLPGSLYVSGTKDFIQNHPYRDDLTIHYTALEGGESATYTRGSARLQGGVAVVPLDDSFAWVTNPDLGLTAHVTPRGRSANLYVESVTTSELTVRCDEGYCGDAVFDYLVAGLRIGYEDYPVVQPRTIDAPVPPAGYHAARQVNDSPMKARSPRERFTRSHQDVFGIAAPVRGRAEELRDAIGVHPFDEVGPVNSGRAAAPDDVPSTGIGGDPTRAGDVAAVPGSRSGESDPPDGLPGIVTTALPTGTGEDVNARSFRSSRQALATTVLVSETVEAGTVLAVDPASPGVLRRADADSGATVFGVVAEDPGVTLGTQPETEVSVAISGVTSCRVDAGFGSIEPGDLLTASPTPGHAMRAVDPEPGTVIGKALEPLDTGTGTVRMLVMMR